MYCIHSLVILTFVKKQCVNEVLIKRWFVFFLCSIYSLTNSSSILGKDELVIDIQRRVLKLETVSFIFF